MPFRYKLLHSAQNHRIYINAVVLNASRYLRQNANRKSLATKNGPSCQWLNKFHEKASETYTDR